MFNFSITLDGKEGIFKAEKRITFYWKYTSKEEITAQLKEVKKEIAKMLKYDYVMIDTSKVDDNTCERLAKKRYIVRKYDCELEVRPYQRDSNDYSKVDTYQFVSENDRYKYLLKEIREAIGSALELIPEKDSYYRQSLENPEQVPQYILEAL
jgi:hypothetical protein